ncbi:MAG TPA: SusC/RagA family TonB-linked outer membrane protein [Puia sp.]|nr:SusC/RagA family TonB-linked outer membrane protein [Puia sp.]
MQSILRFLLAVLLFVPMLVSAQTARTLKGVVTDENNAPLSGVSITVKGTRRSVVTDAQGRFSINVGGPGVSLEISYVGYTSAEIAAGDERTFSVSLHSNGGQMNDVVVTGYGQSAKKNITGAVTSIPAEEFNVGVISTPGELLAGKVAGINITKSGDPNEQPVVILRGASTLRTGSAQQPLYVIDGVPDASIDLVAPSDIATIDVLKDASATAIYGARAANGVIMITTRKPKVGQTRLAYNAYVAAEQVSKRIDMLSAPELRQYLIRQDAPLVGGHSNGNFDDSVNNNWQDQVQRTGVSHNHNIFFGGNTGNTIFGASINYFNNQGIMKTTGLQRTTIRANIEHRVFDDRLRLVLNVMDASSIANQLPGAGGNVSPVYGAMLTYMPTLRAIEPGGVYSTEYPQGPLNPVSLINNNSDQSKAKTFLANALGEVNILPGLKYTLSLTEQTTDTTTDIYFNSLSELARGLNGQAHSTTTESSKKLAESYFNYDKSFGEHTIRLLGGYSWEEDKLGQGFGVTTQNFPNDRLGANNLAVSSPPANTVSFVNSNIGVLRLISYYARVNYQFGEKYLFQASIRDDGSSAFGANHRWGYFPAVSAGWRITKEDFMESTSGWLDDLKLRVGYGVTGNSLGFDPLIAQEQFGIVGRAYTNGSYLDGIGPVQNANPNLRWESTASTNVGADFSVLRGFLNGSIDLYDKTTSNLIWSYPVSATQFPVTNFTTNIGKISNKGVELQLNASLIKTHDFTWRSSFNLAHNINKVLSITNSEFDNQYVYTAFLGGKGQSGNWSQIIEPGHPIGTFDIWHYMGKNAQGVSLFQGFVKGDTTSSPTTANYVIAGNAQPQLLMGWSNTFTYKGFDLNFFFRAVTGNKILNATLATLNDPIDAKTQNLPKFSLHESFNDINSTYISDRFLEKGDYLRLDNATLGYALPIHCKGVSRLRAYVAANNLFVLTGYRGIDPEINIGGLTPGIDNNNYYPKTRSFQFGINANF